MQENVAPGYIAHTEPNDGLSHLVKKIEPSVFMRLDRTSLRAFIFDDDFRATSPGQKNPQESADFELSTLWRGTVAAALARYRDGEFESSSQEVTLFDSRNETYQLRSAVINLHALDELSKSPSHAYFGFGVWRLDIDYNDIWERGAPESIYELQEKPLISIKDVFYGFDRGGNPQTLEVTRSSHADVVSCSYNYYHGHTSSEDAFTNTPFKNITHIHNHADTAFSMKSTTEKIFSEGREFYIEMVEYPDKTDIRYRLTKPGSHHELQVMITPVSADFTTKDDYSFSQRGEEDDEFSMPKDFVDAALDEWQRIHVHGQRSNGDLFF